MDLTIVDWGIFRIKYNQIFNLKFLKIGVISRIGRLLIF